MKCDNTTKIGHQPAKRVKQILTFVLLNIKLYDKILSSS